ncbi:MAG: TIGR03618 family F420-dependent PPOX class oxidoreductase, partial [Sporichthyaceae bacterium]|nr:TIGR03618 family F420-dependent PPOX class oxidoreductase [Sporichthyaceae bacterium]
MLSTFRADGRPQLSPVLIGVDDAGRAVVSTWETTAKARNLRRDPRASVLVLSDQFFGDWIRIDGIADVLSLPDALEPL